MKKIFSFFLAISLAASSIVFADSGAEELLLSVKAKASVPDELSEFETHYFTDENGITAYSFTWHDKNDENRMNIETTSDGNITNYSYSRSEWYQNDSSVKIDKDFNAMTLTSLSDVLLINLVPTLFQNDYDRLVPVPFDGQYELSSDAVYSIEYVRKYHNIEVKDNNAYVTVRNTPDGYIATRARINWDYSKEFMSPDEGLLLNQAEAQSSMNKISPVKLQYRKTYDDNKYLLEYTRSGVTYINAADGTQQNEAENISDLYYKEDMRDESSSSVENSNGKLSEKEVAELAKLNGLKSANELFEKLLSMPELGIDKNIDKSKLRSTTYKSSNEYMVSLSINEASNEGEYSSISATFNAASGELLIFFRHDSSDVEDKNSDNIYSFLNKYYPDKLSQCVLNKETYIRTINDIQYADNYLKASWDSETNRLKSFVLAWDSDISAVPAPQNIISEEKALHIIYEKSPLKPVYILTEDSENVYIPCYVHSDSDIHINAFSGEPTNTSTADTEHYTDVDGHWVKNIANTLCDYGIKLDCKLLNPNETITQGDFLRLVYSGIYGYHMPEAYDYVYRAMARNKVISHADISQKEPVTRENAIYYLLRASGIREVAELDGIYVCNFDDKNDISPSKTGYCAIAKGLNVVLGFDNKLRPRENITKAEALAMIYNYLTR